MTKVWNASRIRRVREWQKRAEERVVARESKLAERQRTYTPGETRKNVRLMLDALGLPIRRRMVARLAREGAMSLSKLAEPFRITLPSSLAQLRVLERSGVVATHKRGRIRMCALIPGAIKELTHALDSSDILRSLD